MRTPEGGGWPADGRQVSIPRLQYMLHIYVDMLEYEMRVIG